MKRIIILFIVLSACTTAFTQKRKVGFDNDTLSEIVVTSTRTATQLGNVTVPYQLINKKNIEQIGSLRLKDILQEQTGLYITNGFGAGVQMQGLNPDYTIILLNGEPLVGRTAGVLDLNRISISNIKRIEIVKGPSSSLYGSEAMAGVINIITDTSCKKSVETGIRYGFGNPDKGWTLPLNNEVFNNMDFNLNASTTIKKTGIQYSGNAYYLDGISYRPYSTIKVPQPIWRFTNQLSLSHPFGAKTKFDLTIRDGYDYIKQEFAVTNNGSTSNSYGREANQDLNINPVLTHQFNANVKSALRLYATIYNGSQILHFTDKPDSSYTDQFKQHFYRAENQTDIQLKKTRLTFGAGYSIDEAQSTRYDNVENKKRNNIQFVYTQQEWNPYKKLILITGVRYDHNKLFAAALSPKFSFRYKFNKSISILGSIGRGFKAPDFRQLYLNFTNNAAGGYSVFGAIDAVKIVNEMQSQGLISEIKEDFNRLKALQPEFSTGINLGSSISIGNKTKINVNLFRNDIESLIDVRQIATKLNGAQIFSYINVKNAYTEGLEFEFIFKLSKKLDLSTGYQYLNTADKEDLQNIKAGKVYTRNSDGTSRLLNKNEYTGLPNRSKHMGNFKINYEPSTKFYSTLRFTYRSKWYIADSDGNGLYNTNDESASGFVLMNASAGYSINKKMKIYGGIDNILNHQDANYLPNLQGRMIYMGINFKLK
jgi:outer membrane receptor for ferrienterochelin and colicins